MTRPLRILSIDGGGIRGYIPALVLAEIERRAAQPALDLFDLIAGTSTGAIIGIGLASKIGAAELAEFYPRYGARIFPGKDTGQSEWSKRLLGTGTTLRERLMGPADTIGSVFGRDDRWGGNARHRADGLEAVLREVLGERMLSQAEKPLLVTSYDADNGRPVVFSSRDATVAPSRFDLPMRLVARATSAAPTYLPPAEFSWDGTIRHFVDGGVWANNPATVAVMESLEMTAAMKVTGQSVFLVSLGTGMAKVKPSFSGEQSWAGSFVDAAKMATSITGADIVAERSLGTSYARLQVIDDRIAGAMDDPSHTRLTALADAARQLIRTNGSEIDRIVSQLV